MVVGKGRNVLSYVSPVCASPSDVVNYFATVYIQTATLQEHGSQICDKYYINSPEAASQEAVCLRETILIGKQKAKTKPDYRMWHLSTMQM